MTLKTYNYLQLEEIRKWLKERGEPTQITNKIMEEWITSGNAQKFSDKHLKERKVK